MPWLSATHRPAAAWLGEKLESWSGAPAFTLDELLTWITAYWITAYWVTGTIGTSFATYTEPVTLPDRSDTPTVLSIFSDDINPDPRSYAEAFLNVREYVEQPVGGHFAAWKQPEAYARDLHRAVELGSWVVLQTAAPPQVLRPRRSRCGTWGSLGRNRGRC